MSLDSMLRKNNTRGDFLYLDEETTTGGKLLKAWRVRYKNVPVYFYTRSPHQEIMAFDKTTVFAEPFIFARCSLCPDITNDDRFRHNGTTYLIKKIDNWAKANKYFRIALGEVR